MAESQALALSARFKGHAKSQSNFPRESRAGARWRVGGCGARALFSRYDAESLREVAEAYLSETEHGGREDNRQTLQTEEAPNVRSQTKDIKGGGKVFVKRSQHSKNCLRRRSASNLCSVVRKPHVPSSMAYIS